MEESMSYGEAVKRLKEIVASIESDQPDIDNLAKQIEEAGTLLKFCKEKLQGIDEEVQKVLDNIE